MTRTLHDPVDVLVIGSGCAGAIVTKTLAEAGVRVTCLEQGHWWQPKDFPHDRADWEWRRLTDWSTAVNVRQQPHDYPVDTGDEMTLMWSGVGGATTANTFTPAAWAGTAALLMASPLLLRALGNRGMIAVERLMGMLLVIIAVQMFFEGLQKFLALQGQAG
jgi:choline dehydrogenase-like flavoprotein